MQMKEMNWDQPAGPELLRDVAIGEEASFCGTPLAYVGQYRAARLRALADRNAAPVTVERVNEQFAALTRTLERMEHEKTAYGRFFYTLGVLVGASVLHLAGWPGVVVTCVICIGFFAVAFRRAYRSPL